MILSDKKLNIDELERALSDDISSELSPIVRIVDDDKALRDAIVFLLMCHGIEAVAYESAQSYLANKSDKHPGCLVLDVKMPEITGIELQQTLKRLSSDLPIIFLSGHGTIDMAVHALLDGAVDFQEKPFHPETLLSSIRKAIDANVEKRKAENPIQEFRIRLDLLSYREKQILIDVAQGLQNKEIADHYGLSFRTIEVHRGQAMHKLGIRTVSEAKRVVSIGTKLGIF